MLLSGNTLYRVWLVCFGGLASSTALAQTIVWTDENARKIQMKNESGGSVSTVVQFEAPEHATRIHYEPLDRKLYYLFSTTSGSSVFQRSNADGSAPETVPTPSASTFALNIESRKLHWISPPTTVSTVNRSELDGSGAQSHTYSTCCVFALHAMGDELFLGAGLQMKKGVWRANADGSNEQFLHFTGPPVDLDFDPVEDKLYIATSEQIDRMNLDGTAFEVVVHLPAWQKLISGPDHIEIDHRGRKLYWTDRVAKVIQRSNLDGSNVEDFVTASQAGNVHLSLKGLTIIQPPSIPAMSPYALLAFCILLILAGSLVAIKASPSLGSIKNP